MSTTVQTPSRIERDGPVYAVSAGLVLALVFLFHESLANLWLRWGNQKELSHSYFIPLITAWMLWDRRDAIRQSMGPSSWLGVAILAFSVILVWGYQTTHIHLLQHIGLFVSFFGVALVVGGVSLLRLCFFPLAYLVFMIPPPFWIITVTSWQFQLWSSELGVAMIRMFDVPVALSGNVIELPTLNLQVVEACSGLRYLFPFLSLGALAAYFYKGPFWQRAIIILSTIPITIVMNSFRIAITGVLSENYGSQHTEGFLHFFEGWVVFLLCIAILLFVVWLVARLSGQKNVLGTLGLPEAKPIRPAQPFERNRFMVVAGVAAAGVAISAVLLHTSEDELRVPERERFVSLPLEFPGWQVQESPLDVETEQALGADDYIVLNLVNPENEQYNLYVAWLDSQRDGNSWHSPRQCLPGGGWEFQQQGIVSDGENNPLGHPYNRIVMKNGQVRYLVYYWYDQRGRYYADEINMKLGLIWDVATRQRSDGAMVRLMTPIDPEESVADADARLIEMARKTEEILQPYIPD
ncbi:VPLPA-CTERM-specific exosortase XrtD [Parvularcula lutaonensis]|uniref:VPLPA-CTERM-specific exosortase XrtD n=1 Tax=Parvularcula lutaonensis TaxID=491923 RepID=A0ABV7MA32_9PROT|nr:VPLPA-CTERM-specific exosortase XrtD [Parvularcula lutaonensis]GGY36558.1 hypothetical protein GCM10007148_00920 [Parvularcula lutaonensis]